MALWKQAILVVVLVVGVAAGWYVFEYPQTLGLGGSDEGVASAGRGSAGNGGGRIPGLIGGGAVNVVTAPVETDEMGDALSALGTAKAARSVTLYPEVSGTVAEVLAVAGRNVHAGDLLFRLQDAEEKVAVEKAQITLEQAQAMLERQKALAKSKTISNVALSDAETTVRMAGVELKSVQIDLDRRSVTAPFDGVIGLTDISIGDFVTTTTALTTIEDLSTMRVEFEVPERWAGRIADGQAISAAAQGQPGSELTGRISGIDNRVDQTTRTLRLQAELANESRALKSGMAIIVRLQFGADQELVVPSLAVQWDRRGSYVWKIVDGAARRADIAIVRRHSGIVIVRGDVVVGDAVVVEGVQRLREGAKVTVVNETPDIVSATPQGDAAKPEDTAVPELSGAERPAGTRS